ncbi:hypothetical protein [Dyella jiangningensis]|uniref:Cobalamin ABC transporter n=1 Tax=Dyella jiangningensis TaxID=1379159 RepID=A0A328P384_9GAMM|nr:hypothetical protein [Dyella jiangningensis]RAO75733.1 hypothetical protein CA260_16960 [Dyella jiangningensis]
MATTQNQRLGIFLALALVMAATRVHLSLFHHDVWDASWAIFFLAGFWLRGSFRWAFPLLIVEAVVVDYIVISNQGISFWDHYCVSAAYWFLVPSYLSLWLGGSWLARQQPGLNLRGLGTAAVAVLGGWVACYVISNGSFYWLSNSVPQPRSVGAWVANMGDWYLFFLEATVLYIALGLVVHALAVQLSRTLGHAGQSKLPH